MFHDENAEEPTYTDMLELDLGDVEPWLAGPKRPQDRVPLTRREGSCSAPRSAASCRSCATCRTRASTRRSRPPIRLLGRQRLRRDRLAAQRTRDGASRQATETAGAATMADGTETELDHGPVVIAAITSVHEHVEPVGDDRRRAAREEGRRARARGQAVGEDQPRRRARRSSPTTSNAGGLDRVARGAAASTSSATAARPASATAGRCPSEIAAAIQRARPGRSLRC